MKPISPRKALLFFGAYGVVLYAVTRFVMPWLEAHGWMPVLAWFFCGTVFVFAPLLVHALVLAGRERPLRQRLRLRGIRGADWLCLLGGFVFIGVATGAILGANHLLAARFAAVPVLRMQAPFLHFEGFTPHQSWMLLLWLPAFVSIILGEELMWRGYLLPRMELHNPRTAWVWNAMLWLGFHAAFGLDLMLVLLPVMLAVPYVVQRRRNTTLGIVLHGVYNGAGFLAVAFGLAS